MSKFEFRNYIFDLDGTLINSLQEVFRCFRVAFSEANYPINEENLTEDVIGPPLREIVKLIAPELKDDAIIDNIVSHFREDYDNTEKDCSFLFDGTKELLNAMKNDGCKLFMATYKPMKPTMRIIEYFELENLFDDIYGIDKFGKHITKTQMLNDIVTKYGLKKSETVMIGDAHTDVIAAREAGVTGIGALWGYGKDKSELTKNSDYTLKSIKDLEKSLLSTKL